MNKTEKRERELMEEEKMELYKIGGGGIMFKGKFIIRMLMLVISILRQKNKKLKQRIKILEGRY